MKKIISAFFLLLFAFMNNVYSLEKAIRVTEIKNLDELNPLLTKPKTKNLKILVLIVASNQLQAWIDLQSIWKKYMHKDKNHFECYFVRADINLIKPFELDRENITVKVEDSYVPGILNKTISSLEAFYSRLDEFDYVLRTNVSSFYVFPRLLTYIQKLPEKNCYAAYPYAAYYHKYGKINFGSGAGFIISSDVAKKIVASKDEISKYSDLFPDDVVIGYFCQNIGLKITPASRVDIPNLFIWERMKNKLPALEYHFRAKSSMAPRNEKDNYSNEIQINNELLKKFY